MTKLKKLTGRKGLFAAEYRRNGGDEIAAARFCGYAEKNVPKKAKELLKDPDVIAHLQAGRDSFCPGIYSKELADKLCMRLMMGESLNAICRDDDMPSKETVCRWLNNAIGADPSESMKDFYDQYAQAKQVQAEMMSDDALDIIDNQADDVVMMDGVPVMVDEKLVTTMTSASVNHAKARVDTRLKLMEKLWPKRFGPATLLKHGDAEGKSMPTMVMNFGGKPTE